MTKFFNIHDILVIGVFALVFIFLANKALTYLGLPQFAASGMAAKQSGGSAGSAATAQSGGSGQ